MPYKLHVIFVCTTIVALFSHAISEELSVEKPRRCPRNVCPKGQECILQDVLCKGGLCHPLKICVDPNDERPSCPADPHREICPFGTRCKLQEVECKTQPCYPVPVCVGPSGKCRSGAITCHPDSRYYLRDVECLKGQPCCPVPECTDTCFDCTMVDCFPGFICVDVPVRRWKRAATPCTHEPVCVPVEYDEFPHSD